MSKKEKQRQPSAVLERLASLRQCPLQLILISGHPGWSLRRLLWKNRCVLLDRLPLISTRSVLGCGVSAGLAHDSVPVPESCTLRKLPLLLLPKDHRSTVRTMERHHILLLPLPINMEAGVTKMPRQARRAGRARSARSLECSSSFQSST